MKREHGRERLDPSELCWGDTKTKLRCSKWRRCCSRVTPPALEEAGGDCVDCTEFPAMDAPPRPFLECAVLLGEAAAVAMQVCGVMEGRECAPGYGWEFVGVDGGGGPL